MKQFGRFQLCIIRLRQTWTNLFNAYGYGSRSSSCIKRTLTRQHNFFMVTINAPFPLVMHYSLTQETQEMKILNPGHNYFNNNDNNNV